MALRQLNPHYRRRQWEDPCAAKVVGLQTCGPQWELARSMESPGGFSTASGTFASLAVKLEPRSRGGDPVPLASSCPLT
jgi:hypothetical protein